MTTHLRLLGGPQRRGNCHAHFISAAAAIALFVSLVSAGASGTMMKGKPRVVARTSWCRCPVPTVDQRQVKILFKGLFYFSIKNGVQGQPRDECRVGILSSRDDHNLFITFPDGRKLEIPPSLLQSLDDITIEKKAPGARPGEVISIPGVTICGYDRGDGWGQPTPRTHRPNEGDPRYYHFNWIIDFEGQELHKEDIQLNQSKLKPVLHFKTGDFYTAAISDLEYFTVIDGIGKRFGYVAAATGACITLDPDQWLEIGGGISPPLIIRIADIDASNPSVTISLANVRPTHQHYVEEYVRQRILKIPGTRTLREALDSDPLPPDEITIFYNDLLRLRDPRKRAYFIPIEPKKRSDPFVCYGGGGSVFP
jgi:hypothetical protein